MSAFVVDRDHIVYLIAAAKHFDEQGMGSFCWVHNGEVHYIDSPRVPTDKTARLLEIGTMLWEENIKAVMERYSDCTRDNLPGPCDENFKLREGDLIRCDWPEYSFRLDKYQVLMAADCYEYQACEDSDWETSEAKAFIDSLRKSAWQSFGRYKDAKWGAPKVPPDRKRPPAPRKKAKAKRKRKTG